MIRKFLEGVAKKKKVDFSLYFLKNIRKEAEEDEDNYEKRENEKGNV